MFFRVRSSSMWSFRTGRAATEGTKLCVAYADGPGEGSTVDFQSKYLLQERRKVQHRTIYFTTTYDLRCFSQSAPAIFLQAHT